MSTFAHGSKRNSSKRNRALATLVFFFTVLSCGACAKHEAKEKAVPSAAPVKSSLPVNVDAQLYSRLRELSKSCKIDLSESNVVCQNRGLESLNDQIIQGARSQSRSLDTVAYALAQPDEKLVTVAAELLQKSFLVPIEEKDPKPTSKETALSLIHSLSKLHDLQALDASPAIVYAAMRTGTEAELYKAVENHPYKRLISRTYRYLLAAGGMRAFGKVQELISHERMEVAMSALDAPTMLKEKTPEDRTKICDWYKSLTSDARPIVATRASGYLIVCGPVYIERMLAADEAAVLDPKVTKLNLNSYQQMCRREVIAVTGPTPDQCARLKKLLIAILQDQRFDGGTRYDAITSVTANFPDPDVLAVLKKHTHDKNPIMAQRANDALVQITRDIARAARQEAAEKAKPSE